MRKKGEETQEVLSEKDIAEHPLLGNQPVEILNTQFSHNHRYIAVSLQLENTVGIIVKDLENQEMKGFYAQNVDEFCVFDEADGLYYVEKDKLTGKGKKVVRVDLNPALTEEECILQETKLKIAKQSSLPSRVEYEERDPNFTVELGTTLSGQYVLIRSDNLATDPGLQASEFRFKPSNSPEKDFLIVQERKEGVFYTVKQQEEEFYILVVTQEKPNGEILKVKIPPYNSYAAPQEPPQLSESTELTGDFLGAEVYLSHDNNVLIEHMESFHKHLVQILTDTETSLQYIQVQNLESGGKDLVTYSDYEGHLKIANNKSYRINLLPENQNYFSETFKYKLSTLHSPNQILNYDLNSRTNDLEDLEEYIKGVNLSDYTSERIVLPANDQERIPLTLVYNKKFVKSGDNFMVLHTSGGDTENWHKFTLDYRWLSMLDRGVVWAIPHIRGSPDLNLEWYKSGVGLNKKRHFQDLLDISVSLVGEKIARHLCVFGEGPSGGLTAASVLMKEPNLYSGVVLRNPILDLISYVKHRRTTTEFGSLYDSANYSQIKNYSPYHQPTPLQDMSHLLITTDFDHECAFHAMKFVAKLREIPNSYGNLILYKEYPTWTPASHKCAEEFSFLLSESIHYNKTN